MGEDAKKVCRVNMDMEATEKVSHKERAIEEREGALVEKEEMNA